MTRSKRREEPVEAITSDATGAVTSPPIGAAPELPAVMAVGDAETLRALSDPLRLRILEAMAVRFDPAWSVKELARTLGVPQTRLYHHVDLLVERGLVVPAERRIVSGILETRYRAAARSFQLDRRLFAGRTDAARAALHAALSSVFDRSRDEIEQATEAGTLDLGDDAPPERRLLLSRGIVGLSPARAAELRSRLLALIEEYGADGGPETRAYGLVLALYPAPPSHTADTSGETVGG